MISDKNGRLTDEPIDIIPEQEPKKILYLCDKRACETCHPDCTHTHDVTHAKNFRLMNHSFLEEPAPRVVLKYPGMLKQEVKERIMADLNKQLKDCSGIIAVDSSVEIVRLDPSDAGKFDSRVFERSMDYLGIPKEDVK